MNIINPIKRNTNQTDTLIIYATMTMASLLRKYNRLEAESRYNDNVLTGRVSEILRLSKLVNKVEDCAKDDVFQATLIMNNSGVSFNKKLRELKKIKFEMLKRCGLKDTGTTGTTGDNLQRAVDELGGEENVNEPDETPSRQTAADAEAAANADAAATAQLNEINTAITNLGPTSNASAATALSKGLATTTQERKSLDQKIQQLTALLAQQKLFGGASPGQQATAPNDKKKTLDTITALLTDIVLEAATVNASGRHWLEQARSELQRYQATMAQGAPAGQDDTEKIFQILEEAAKTESAAADTQESEILKLMVDAINNVAKKYPKTNLNGPDVISNFKKDLFSEELTLKKELAAHDSVAKKLENDIKSAKEVSKVIDNIALETVLTEATKIFDDCDSFNSSVQPVVVRPEIKTATGTLARGLPVNGRRKLAITKQLNVVQPVSDENIKNMLKKEGLREKDSTKFANIDTLKWTGGAPARVDVALTGAAEVLYNYAKESEKVNANINAGYYASVLYNRAVPTAGIAAAVASLPNDVSINIAARMSGAMYAANKHVSPETCGKVAAEAVEGFLREVVVDHLMKPSKNAIGHFVAYSDMGVPSYPSAVRPTAGQPAAGAFDAESAPMPDQATADKVAKKIANLIVNGHDIAEVASDAKAELAAGAAPAVQKRIDYVVRELMTDSLYLEHIVTAQAEAGATIGNAVGAPAGAAGNNPARAAGGIDRDGAIPNIRVVDNDVYYTVINIATSVFVSTGDEAKAVAAGTAVGKLMVMFKYGHNDLVRVHSAAAAYIGIYVAIALAMIGKSSKVAAATGFVFGQGYDHHENVRLSIVAALVAPTKLAIFDPAPNPVAGGNTWMNLGGGGRVPGHLIGNLVSVNTVGPHVPAAGGQSDAYLHDLQDESDVVFAERNNDAYINAPLLYRTYITAHNKIRERRNATLKVGAATDLYAREPPGAAAPAERIVIRAGPVVELNQAQEQEIIDAATDVYETAKSAAGRIGAAPAAVPYDNRDIRIAFKLFQKIVEWGAGAPAQAASVATIAINNAAPHLPNASLGGVVGGGGDRVIRLTVRAPAVAPLRLTNDRVDTVSDLLFRAPSRNGISYYEVRSPGAPGADGFAELVGLTDKQINIIQYFLTVGFAAANGIGAGARILPANIYQNPKFQEDILRFSTMLYSQTPAADSGWDLDTSKACQIGSASVRGWDPLTAQRAIINKYNALYLFPVKAPKQEITDTIKSTVEEQLQTQDLIDGSNKIKLSLDTALSNFKDYAKTIEEANNAIASYNGGNPIEKIAVDVSKAINLSANATLKILEASNDINDSTEYDSARTAFNGGTRSTQDAEKDINEALDAILKAYSDVGNFPAYGALARPPDVEQIETALKKIITDVKNENDLNAKLIKSYDLLAAAQLVTDIYNGYDPRGCQMLTTAGATDPDPAAGAAVPAPLPQHEKFNIILGGVKAVSTAIKTLTASKNLLMSAKLKETANYLGVKGNNTEKIQTSDAIKNTKKALEDLTSDIKNNIPNSKAKESVIENVKGLYSTLTRIHHNQRRTCWYKDNIKNDLALVPPQINSITDVTSSVNSIESSAKEQCLSQQKVLDSAKKIMSLTLASAIQLLAASK